MIKWSYMIFVSSEKFKVHTTRHWSPRSIRPLDFTNEFIKFSLLLGKCFQCYQENIWNNNFKDSMCDLYTMDYIYQSPTHFSKGNIGCVLQCTKFPDKNQWLYLPYKLLINLKTIHETWRWSLKKRGKNKHTYPIFDNDFLASWKQMKMCNTDYIFPIKQDNICYYKPLCFMSSVLMLDNIIMNLFTDRTKKSTKAHKNHFSSEYRMIQFTCTKDLCRILHGKEKWWCKKDDMFASLHWKIKIRKMSVW